MNSDHGGSGTLQHGPVDVPVGGRGRPVCRFHPAVTWIDSRRKEREAFYKADTMRRVAESSAEGGKAAIELMREEERGQAIKVLEGLKIGGLINLGVGVGLIIFLRAMLGGGAGSPYLCGLIPGFIGVAMLAYVYLMAEPIQ